MDHGAGTDRGMASEVHVREETAAFAKRHVRTDGTISHLNDPRAANCGRASLLFRPDRKLLRYNARKPRLL